MVCVRYLIPSVRLSSEQADDISLLFAESAARTSNLLTVSPDAYLRATQHIFIKVAGDQSVSKDLTNTGACMLS